jgi:hypothetical protein
MFRADVIEKSETFYAQCTFSLSLTVFEKIKQELLRSVYVSICVGLYAAMNNGLPNTHEYTEQSAVVLRSHVIITEQSAIVFRRRAIVTEQSAVVFRSHAIVTEQSAVVS